MRPEIHHTRSFKDTAMLPLLDPGVSVIMPITSVNLDDETHSISKRVGNFSEFVRECLRRWNAYDQGIHIQQAPINKQGKKCFPMHKKGCCVLCWPDGPPTREDWGYYVEAWKTTPESATRHIEEQARKANVVSDFPIPQESKFQKPRKKKIGFFAGIRESIRRRGE